MLSLRRADRVTALLDQAAFPVVPGGDCGILLGNMLALRRRGRYGLIFVEGHSDFRHPGNSGTVGSAAGEDPALVTGRGDALANLEGHRSLVLDSDVAAIGVSGDDEGLSELKGLGIEVRTADDVLHEGAAATAQAALAQLGTGRLDGFWIYCHVDVLDSAILLAADTPEPGGLRFHHLSELLGVLLADRRACGIEITIFDPDLDESGELSRELPRCMCDASVAEIKETE